jgi:hypothetical protein
MAAITSQLLHEYSQPCRSILFHNEVVHTQARAEACMDPLDDQIMLHKYVYIYIYIDICIDIYIYIYIYMFAFANNILSALKPFAQLYNIIFHTNVTTTCLCICMLMYSSSE